MGTYFTPVTIDAAHNVVRAINTRDYGSGDKLAGHTRADAPLMTAVETLLALDGGARLVWAGDYNGDDGADLYFSVEEHHFVRFAGLIDPDEDLTPNAQRPVLVTAASHPYICNAGKCQYIDKRTLPVDDYGQRRNPLPALTAEGGRAYNSLVDSWARDRIYLSAHPPGHTWTEVPQRIWT